MLLVYLLLVVIALAAIDFYHNRNNGAKEDCGCQN